MNKRKNKKLLIFLAFFFCFLLAVDFGFPSCAKAADWYDSNWQYRKKITIPSSQVDGSSQTNFPAYVDLANLGSDFFSHVRSDGGDIRITKTDGTTELPREVVSINTGSQTGELHFRADNLSNSSNNEFYIYYGNSSASNYTDDATYGAQNVWTNGFAGVWHLNEDSNTTRYDSTSNQNNLTAINTPSYATGKIGNAVDLERADTDYLYCTEANCPTLDIYGANQPLSISAWVNFEEVTVQAHMIASKYDDGTGNSQYRTFITGTNSYFRTNLSSNGTSLMECWGPASLSVSTWYYVNTIYDDTDVRNYLNGSLNSGSNNPKSYTGGIYNGTANFAIGISYSSGSPTNRFDGLIDEARISNVARSAGWIKTEYNNQFAPTSFYSIGIEESSGPPDMTPPSAVSNLSTSNITLTSVQLRWTAPGDDGSSGTAMSYDIRYSTSDITDANWGGATQVTGEPSPQAAGTNQSFNVTGLNPSTTYYFAIKTSDEVPNTSGLSNVVSGTTLSSTNLISHWRLDETSGTTADDSAGTNNGTLVNGPVWNPTGGRIDGALSFDGSDDYVNFGTGPSLNGQTNFTVSAWIKTGSATEQTIIQQRNGGYNGEYWLVVQSGGKLEFNLYGDANYQCTSAGVVSSGNINDNSWHHVVGLRNGANLNIYIDGSPAGNCSGTIRNLVSSISVAIGRDIRDSNKPFSGLIDDVRIYNQALSASEVLDLYNSAPPSVGAWYSPNWPYRKIITIDKTKVAGDLTNFPVLIRFDSDADLASKAQDDGDDIVFTDASGVLKLSHEIEKFDGNTGELSVWVKVPNLSSSVDTIIQMHYGNASASNQQNPAGVWDNYAGVWHLNEASGTRHDSTANNNDLSDINTIAQGLGKINNAADFESGNNQLLEKADSASLNISGSDQSLSLELWFNPESMSGSNYLVSKYDTGANQRQYALAKLSDNKLYFNLSYNGSSYISAVSNTQINAGQWYYLATAYNDTDMRVYLNGVLDSSLFNPIAYTSGISSGSTKFALGARYNNGATEGFLDGLLDEVRVSKVARSVEWIATSYNNQSSPTSFYTLAAEENTPANGLISLWRLDETSGTTADDSVGTNNGTLVNFPGLPTWTTGKINGALSFDESNDYVNVPDSASLDFTNQFTVSAWVKKKVSDESGYGEIVARRYGTDYGNVWELYYKNTANDEYGFGVRTTSGVYITGPSSTGDFNTWVHLVGVYDGSNVRLYKNGNQIASASQTGNMPAETTPLTIGADDNGTAGILDHVNAVIDDIRIYNRALSASEVLDLYNEYNPLVDTTPPSAITDLKVTNYSSTSALLSWTAPGDDGNTGTASSYDIRYSTAIGGIVESDWDTAIQVANEPTPLAAGTNQTFLVTGLNPETTYFFAMKTSDEVPNTSALSNNAGVLTTGVITWYSSNWQYRLPLTIPKEKVSGTSELINFPLLVSLILDPLKVGKSNGGDIVFALADGTKLDYEIEKYDSGTGELIAWVRIPSLSPNFDNEIYIYYGNANTPDQGNPEGVWDSYYQGVWHLKEESAGIGASNLYKDSTINKRNGDDHTAAIGKEGQIGLGQEFDGEIDADDYIDFKNTPAWNLAELDFTIEFWFKSVASSSDSYAFPVDRYIGGYPGAGYHCNVYRASGTFYCGNRASSTSGSYNHLDMSDYSTGINFFVNHNWHQAVMTVNQSIKRGYLYIDGILRSSDTWWEYLLDYNDELYFGGSSGSTYTWPGFLDEFRISHTQRSSEWIKTQFNNQNSPATFYTLGTEEDNGPPPPDTIPPERYNGFPADKQIWPPGKTTAKLSLQTNESATCRYSLSPNVDDYGSMTSSFSSADNFNHTAEISGFADGISYNYYVRCRDTSPNLNANADDYIITFIVNYLQDSGLWGAYSQEFFNTNSSSVEDKYLRFINAYKENIDFNNFNNTLFQRTGQTDDNLAKWQGGIYIEEAGIYTFDAQLSGGNSGLNIDGLYLWYGISGNKTASLELSVGWHTISFEVRITSSSSWVRLRWTPPGKLQDIIPAGYLNPNTGGQDVIAILGGEKERLNYVTAGVGTAEAVNPTIEIDLGSAGVNLSNILKNDIWVIFVGKKLSSPSGIIRNNYSGEIITVNLKYPTTVYGLSLAASEYPTAFAKIPESLIALDGAGKLSLTFLNSDNERGGIGIIIPYIDSDQPQGRISILVNSGIGYHRASEALIFPIESITMTKVTPFFMFSDGETKIGAASPTPWYRPNYLYTLSGTEAEKTVKLPDGEFTVLKNIKDGEGNQLATMIMPVSGPISLTATSTWYPNFGREGPQFDVLAPADNYLKNLWEESSGYNTYVTNKDGAIDPIIIPSGNSWIAFQYTGSNLNADIDGVDGGGESGVIVTGAVFSTLDVEIPPPGLPSNLVADPDVECENMYLSWQDTSFTETRFELERSTDGVNFSSLDNDIPADTTAYVDSFLTGGQTYWYRIRACNDAGCSFWSNIASARAVECIRPIDYTLSNSGDITAIIVENNPVDSTETRIYVSSVTDFNGSICLSVTLPPGLAGATASFSPDSTISYIGSDPPDISDFENNTFLKIEDIPGDTSPGNHQIVIEGDGNCNGTLPRQTIVNLKVNSFQNIKWIEI